MNNLPLNLAYGEISIYGINNPGITGISPPSGFNFGNVDQISQYGISYTSIGQSVLFKGDSIICTINYTSGRYLIINETAIIATEIPLP